jgi:hypothetical protein
MHVASRADMRRLVRCGVMLIFTRCCELQGVLKSECACGPCIVPKRVNTVSCVARTPHPISDSPTKGWRVTLVEVWWL